jgi:hypothetical protein
MAAHTDERLKITIAQKKAIRNYYKVEKPRGHKMVKQWFKKHYAIDLPTSTISNILSSKFDRIDQLSSTHDDAKRCRPPKYPDLETALAECISRMKTAGIDLTGAVLLSTAHELWPKIPSYIGQPPPTLSGGWVEKFKTRHGIKLRCLQVEAASTRERVNQAVAIASANSPNQPSMIDLNSTLNGLDRIYAKTVNYRRDDIFTMSETELFWRLVPNANALRDNASYPRGVPNERITVALATNATGTKRLSPWIIGHFKTQRSFDAPGNDIKSLNAVYSSNVLAWMTASEWRKWLLWFDSLMDHPVLLLISPSGPHEVAFTTLIDQASLRFTTVELLPPNILFQPMELGIFQNFKALYRKTLLSFISDFYLQQDIEHHLPEPVFNKSQELETFNQGLIQTLYQIEDPHYAINLYIAIFWIQKAWINDLDFASITQAWSRSNLLNGTTNMNFTNTDMAPISPTSLSTVTVPAVTALSNPSSVISPNLITDIMCLIQSIRVNPASLAFMGDMNDSLPVETYVYPLEETPSESVDDFIELATAQFYETSPDLFSGPIYVYPTNRIPRNSIKLLPSFDDQQQETNPKYMSFINDLSKTSRQNSIASIIEPNFNLQVAPTGGDTSPISALQQQPQMIMPLPVTQMALKMSPKSGRRKSSPSSAKAASTIMSRNSSLSSTASFSGVATNPSSASTTSGTANSTLLSSVNPLSSTSPSALNSQQPFNLPSPVNFNTNLVPSQSLPTGNGGNYYSPVSYFGMGGGSSRLINPGAGSVVSGASGYGPFSFDSQQQQSQPQQPQQGYASQGFSSFMTSTNPLINPGTPSGNGNQGAPYSTYTTARSAGLDINPSGPSANNGSNGTSDNSAAGFLGHNPSVYFSTPNS